MNLPQNLPIQFELLPKNKSLEIIFSYQEKFDYFELDWNGKVRTFEARSDKIPREPLEKLSEDEGSEFKCPYNIIDDKDYSIIVIESLSTAEDDLPEAYVYFINKETFEVTYKFYPKYRLCTSCN